MAVWKVDCVGGGKGAGSNQKMSKLPTLRYRGLLTWHVRIHLLLSLQVF